MPDDKKSIPWRKILKLAAVVIIFLLLVGLGLYYTVKFSTYSPEAHSRGESKPAGSWGITKDSPIRNQR